MTYATVPRAVRFGLLAVTIAAGCQPALRQAGDDGAVASPRPEEDGGRCPRHERPEREAACRDCHFGGDGEETLLQGFRHWRRIREKGLARGHRSDQCLACHEQAAEPE